MPVTPTYPQLPTPHTEQGLFGCFQHCELEQQFDMTITINSFSLLNCDRLQVTMTITPTAGAMPVGPTMVHSNVFAVGKYSRTWRTDINDLRQVWRFLINGTFSFMGGQPCPVPPCFGTFGEVPFSGFIDISCGPGPFGPTSPRVWSVAMSLSHYPGCASHNDTPFNTKRLPVGNPARHEDRSYHLVAPVPFTFLNAPAPSPSQIAPNSSFDSVRSTLSPNTLQEMCLSELGVETVVVPVMENCLCDPGMPANPSIYFHESITNGTNAICQTTTGTLRQPILSAFVDANIPTGFVQQYIGQWGATVLGHSSTFLFGNFGLISYTDVCPQSQNPDFHFTYGVATLYGGGLVQDAPNLWFGGLGSIKMPLLVDFVNSFDDTPPFPPRIGNTVRSTVVWQFAQ